MKKWYYHSLHVICDNNPCESGAEIRRARQRCWNCADVAAATCRLLSLLHIRDPIGTALISQPWFKKRDYLWIQLRYRDGTENLLQPFRKLHGCGGGAEVVGGGGGGKLGTAAQMPARCLERCHLLSQQVQMAGDWAEWKPEHLVKEEGEWLLK